MEDDRERTQLLQKILDLLLAGGYFRARIYALSVFDKLTGGLAWCITFSKVDVDFDVLYDDDATLYYKIKVGEAIEDALQRMGCPHPLQAHQIQGLDYQAVLPVTQWLVKRVMATREEFGDQARGYAHLRYQENYKLPNETSLHDARLDKILCKVKSFSQEPLQLHKSRIVDSPIVSKGPVVTTQEPSNKSHKSGIADSLETTKDRPVDPAQPSVPEPLQRMTKIATSDSIAVSKDDTIGEVESSNQAPHKGTIVASSLLTKDRFAAPSHAQPSVRVSAGGRWPIMLEEAKFREDYKRKCAKILARIRLKDPAPMIAEDDDNFTEVNMAYNLDLQKWCTLRSELSKRNFVVALLQRRLDEMPSQTELMQYERRFVELYIHIQRKLRETRKYYATYNALAEGNEVTLKELSLLNSIHAQFEVAMTTAGGRSKFVESMEGIGKGVEQKLHQVEKRFEEEQTTLTSLKEKHATAVAAQRQYYAVVQHFQEECARNEKLQLKLGPGGPPQYLNEISEKIEIASVLDMRSQRNITRETMVEPVVS